MISPNPNILYVHRICLSCHDTSNSATDEMLIGDGGKRDLLANLSWEGEEWLWLWASVASTAMGDMVFSPCYQGQNKLTALRR